MRVWIVSRIVGDVHETYSVNASFAGAIETSRGMCVPTPRAELHNNREDQAVLKIGHDYPITVGFITPVDVGD